MDNFVLNKYMDLAEAYVGPIIDAIDRRLMDRDFALEDPEVFMLLAALRNILGHDNRGDRPTEVFIDDSIWRKTSTRPSEHEGNEVEKRGSLSK